MALVAMRVLQKKQISSNHVFFGKVGSFADSLHWSVTHELTVSTQQRRWQKTPLVIVNKERPQ